MGASFLNLVATKVTVKGEEQKFVSLHLRQGFNRHHTFTVVVNYLSPNNTFQQTPEKFIGYIGETASISFVHRQTGESYDFEGIITQVEMVGSMGETGGVAIHGTSPTILYENNRTRFLDGSVPLYHNKGGDAGVWKGQSGFQSQVCGAHTLHGTV